MRICLIAPEFQNGRGGVGAYCTDFVNHLPDETEVHVVTLQANGHDNGGERSVRESLPSNVFVHSVSNGGDTFFYNAKFQYAVNRIVPKLHKELGFNIVHSNHAHMSDLFLKLRQFRVPSITTFHTTLATQRKGSGSSGLPLRRLERSEKVTFLLFPLMRRIENIYLARTRNAICVSDFVRRNLHQEYDVSFNNVETIHNGVDLDLFSRSKRDKARDFFPGIAEHEGPKVLFCGRLIGLKGIHVLIRSMRDVLREFPKTMFIFAGEGNREHFTRLAARLRIPTQSLAFLGRIDRSRMPYLYVLSNVYVLPSFSESCPMGILEAMASGTPVVASNVGGIPELVEDGATGRLIPPGDPKILARTIISILQDPQEASFLAGRALERVRHKFSIQEQVENTLVMYEKVLDD